MQVQNISKQCNTCDFSSGLNCSNEKAHNMNDQEIMKDVLDGYSFACRYWKERKKK